VSVGATAGGAYAYWTTHSTGTGLAQSGAAASATIMDVNVDVASGVPATALHPGGTAELLVQVRNPGGADLTITGVAQQGQVVVDGGKGCTPDDAAVSVTTTTGLAERIPAGTTTVVRLPGVAAMGLASASGCQGATFHIPVVVTVQG
jgi:hypothetical protein